MRTEEFVKRANSALLDMCYVQMSELTAVADVVYRQASASRERLLIAYETALMWGDTSEMEHRKQKRPQAFSFLQPSTEESLRWNRLVEQSPDFTRLAPECRALVMCNLGNALSVIGRVIAALEYWRQAIDLGAEEPSECALLNMAIGLENYGKYAPREAMRRLALKSNSIFNRLALTSKSRTVATAAMRHLGDSDILIRKHQLGPKLSPIRYDQAIPLSMSTIEASGLLHRLYINPLNDLATPECPWDWPEERMLGDLKEQTDAAPCLNRVVSEFVLLRQKATPILQGGIPRTPDKTRELGSLYRSAFCLFDRLAHIVNILLGAGFRPGEVQFERVWMESERNGTSSHSSLNQDLTSGELQNWPLRGLYWVSHDLRAERRKPPHPLDELLQGLPDLRNCLEHRFVDIKFGAERMHRITNKTLIVTISPEELAKRTIALLRIVREGIMYSWFAIRSSLVSSANTRHE